MRGRASVALMAAALLLGAPLLSGCGDPAPTPKSDAVAPTTAEQTPVMPEDAPPQEEADAAVVSDGPAKPCTDDIGEPAAVRLAERCTRVSPASHPPCNPANPCALIQGEIDRSCALYGPNETKPAECSA